MSVKDLLMSSKLAGSDVVCVDLSGETLKLAHGIKSVGGKTTVANLTSRKLSGLADDAVSEAVGAAIDEMGVRNPFVIGVIPSNVAITRSMEIPSTEPGEVREIVNLQASRHTPYSKEDVTVAYINMGVYKGAYTRVLLVVVGHDSVKRNFDVLEKAGFSVQAIVFGPEAVANVFSQLLPAEGQDSVVGVIHMDESFTDFMILFRSKPIFLRSISIGNQHLADEPDSYRERFVEELRKSLEVYRAEKIEARPEKLVFVGAVGMVGEIKSHMDEKLSLPTEVISYSDSLPVSEDAMEIAASDKSPSFFNVAASLFAYGEMEVDLVPEDVKSRRQFEQRTRDAIKTGILMIALLLLICGILLANLFFKMAYLERLDSQYRQQMGRAMALEAGLEKVGIVKNYLKGTGFALEVLTELHKLLPDDLRLEDVKFDSTRTDSRAFVIKGVSKTGPSVDELVKRMDESKLFDSVKRERLTKKEGEEKLFDFEIRSGFKI